MLYQLQGSDPMVLAASVAVLTLVALSAGFTWHAYKLWRNYSEALSRKTFRFSLIHLSVLFAALLIDHYL